MHSVPPPDRDRRSEMMDTALTSAYKGTVSLVDHKGKEPARCLDIGTGVSVVVTITPSDPSRFRPWELCGLPSCVTAPRPSAPDIRVIYCFPRPMS